MKNTEKTGIIVAFHIGRGGHWNNAGHVTYIGEDTIDRFTSDDNIFTNYENIAEVRWAIGDNEALGDLLEKATNDMSTDGKYYRELAALGFDLGEVIYTDGSGNSLGLTLKECESGVGRIDIDGAYNTTYCQHIEDLSVSELRLILNDEGYKSYALEKWINEYFADEIFEKKCEEHDLPRSVNMHKIK